MRHIVRLLFGAVAAASPLAGCVVAQIPAARVVADFEGAAPPTTVEARYGALAVSAPGDPSPTRSLRWTLEGVASYAEIVFSDVPSDVTGFRVLTFGARLKGASPGPMSVRFETTREAYLGIQLETLPNAWRPVEVDLSKMEVVGAFDPRKVASLAFIFFNPKAAEIHLDDLTLAVRPQGGWRRTDAEILVDVFGKARAERAALVETANFKIYTESAGAEGKFPSALEKIYGFVRKHLGCDAIDPKLPVYIFSNATNYYDYCRRLGWSKEAAERTAGHGSGESFATFFQAPEAPTVVHELTHSLFHRTYGWGGGSWLQEGAAVYIENLYQRKSIGGVFSERVRSGRFMPLKEFVKVEELISRRDVRDAARTSGALYDQAGAFFEFMKRGPYGDGFEKKLKRFGEAPRRDVDAVQLLERVLGAKVDEIEAKWKEWSRKPPPLPKEGG
ncbi:MAG TPA: hypothetical protein VEI02_13535 [Planctomycetota bacterium]|nr:hypothetical protein [Planctomycetota bacterium]